MSPPLRVHVGPVCAVIWLSVFKLTPSVNHKLAPARRSNKHVLHTDNVKLAAVRPVVAVDSPVRRPCSTTSGHGKEVANEETAVVRLLGLETYALQIS